MRMHLLTKSVNAVALLLALQLTSARAGIVFSDGFETYLVQSPAPSPLTNGPAGGEWWYVDPTPPTIANNEHRITDSGTGGSGLQSRVWISNANGAQITNAITPAAIKPGTNVQVFTVSFLAATDTTTAGRIATFKYDIGSSSGGLRFVSGGNLEGSQTFTGLSGYGLATNMAIGKTDARKFRVVFTATNFTSADKIFVGLTRVTNTGTAGVYIAIDDVSLAVQIGLPEALVNPQSASVTAGDSVTFSAVFTNFPNQYQWTFNGADIPGATGTSYTIPFVTKADEGAYALVATSDEGSVSTVPAALTVTDTTAPTLTEASALLTLQNVRVRFSEPVEEQSGINGVYSLSGSAQVLGVAMVDRFTVELTTTELNPATAYTVTASNIQDLGGNVITSSSKDFTTAALVPAVRYDAGTTTTRPGGPPLPEAADGGYWTFLMNTNAGFSTNAVVDDNGTGYNAWNISDNNIAAGTGNQYYQISVDPASDSLAQSNGWRLVTRTRYNSLPYTTGGTPAIFYSDPNGNRYVVFLAVDANGNLVVSLLGGGGSFTVSSDPQAYHTHMLVYDPTVSTNASYYFDGQLLTTNYAGAASTDDGVYFGMGSAAGTGDMNYNLVELDVVGGVQPTVLTNPESIMVSEGQQATFTAEFTPFVGRYQWLSNGVAIADTDSNSYTTPYTTLGMNGAQYRCRALHALGAVESAAATLTVTADTNPPVIAAIEGSILLDRATVTYSEPVIAQYATNIANYVWQNPGLTTLSARLVDAATVELRTTTMQPGSNYTVLVSQVRDRQNLVIANNSPGSFKALNLKTLALYDAGTSATRPAGPPAPDSAEGGSWTGAFGTQIGSGLITNAVINDLDLGWNAWTIADQTTTSSQFVNYTILPSEEQNVSAGSNGWVMTIRSRFVDAFGSSSLTIICFYANQDKNRTLLWFGLSNGELVVRPENGVDQVLTVGGGTLAYHLHQVVYDPATATASYYFDGELKYSGWVAPVVSGVPSGIRWGNGSTAGMGGMNFNIVKLEAVEPSAVPAVSIAPNGSSVDVQYTGILEAAGTLENNATWTPVATNAGPSSVLLSMPATGQQRFFRTRSAE